ncbi:MAG: hypothetical protein LW870_11765, partial [Pirellula sp.]|nr:hypothetical protein [Pirellula sp.]
QLSLVMPQTKLLRKPYMGNLYVRFDEGEGSAKSRPSLLYWLVFEILFLATDGHGSNTDKK